MGLPWVHSLRVPFGTPFLPVFPFVQGRTSLLLFDRADRLLTLDRLRVYRRTYKDVLKTPRVRRRRTGPRGGPRRRRNIINWYRFKEGEVTFWRECSLFEVLVHIFYFLWFITNLHINDVRFWSVWEDSEDCCLVKVSVKSFTQMGWGKNNQLSAPSLPVKERGLPLNDTDEV